MRVVHPLKMDLIRPWGGNLLNMVQGDSNTRIVELQLFSDGVEWEIPSVELVTVAFKKPDQHKGFYETEYVIQGNCIQVVLAPQVLTAYGKVTVVIELHSAEGSSLASFPFGIMVSQNPEVDAEASEDYFNYVNPFITEALEKVEEAANEANEAAEKANSASEVAYRAERKVDALREVVSKFHSNIVEEAKGDIITLDDASDMELAGLKVFGKTTQKTTTGKNLLDIDTIKVGTANTTLERIDENTVRLYNTVARKHASTESSHFLLRKGISYTVSCNVDRIVSGYIAVALRNTTNQVKKSLAITATGKHSFTYTPTEDVEVYFSLFVTFDTEEIGDATFSDMQVEVGSTATAYEPYTGGIPSPNPYYPQPLESVGEVAVSVKKGNLLTFPYSNVSQTLNGIDFTVNADGSVTLKGTATREAMFYLSGQNSSQLYLPVGTYYFNGVPSGDFGGKSKPQFYVTNNMGAPAFAVFEGGRKVDITVPGIYRVFIDIVANNTFDNVTFYPMINVGGSPLPYEPPEAAQTLTLSTPNGLPGIPVTSGGNYTDENGRQWICDEVDFEKGVYIQRIGKINTANVTCTKSAFTNPNGNVFVITIDNSKNYFMWEMRSETKNLSNATLSQFTTATETSIRHRHYIRFVMEETNVTDANTRLHTEASDIIYALGTPIETALSAEELAQYATLHTNYPNTTVFNDGGAGMEVKYVADTKLYVDKKFAELAAALVNNV